MDPKKQLPIRKNLPRRLPPPRREAPRLPTEGESPPPLPTRTSPTRPPREEIEEEEEEKVQKTITPALPFQATVWDCRINNGKNGIMVSLGEGNQIFLDDHLKESVADASDVNMDLKMIFRGGISKIIQFLPPEQSNKLVESIDNLFLYRVKIRQHVKPPNKNMGKRIVRPKEDESAGEESEGEEDKRLAKYQEILEKAKDMDFTEFERMNIVLVDIGRDKSDRPIILFKERGFTKEQVDRLIYFILQKIDSVANKEYTLVWCIYNSRKKGEKVYKPGLQWLLSVYRSLSRKVRKNLKSLYLIHPTLMYNVIIKFFKPFVSKKFWRKLNICNSVADVEKKGEIDLRSLPLPPGTCCYNIEKYREKCDVPMFEVDLKTVYSRRENLGREVPLVLDQCLDYLSEQVNHNNGNVVPVRVEGIFRKAGNKTKISDLKMSYNHGYNVGLVHVDIHCVSGLVKLWFRELVDPVIPFNLYPEFLKLHPDHLQDIQKMRYVMNLIPMPNFSIVKRIFLFLKLVSEYKEDNKMDTMNLAIVFGPNLLRSESEDRLKILSDSQKIMNVVDIMIQNSEQIFADEDEEYGEDENTLVLDFDKLKEMNENQEL